MTSKRLCERSFAFLQRQNCNNTSRLFLLHFNQHWSPLSTLKLYFFRFRAFHCGWNAFCHWLRSVKKICSTFMFDNPSSFSPSCSGKPLHCWAMHCKTAWNTHTVHRHPWVVVKPEWKSSRFYTRCSLFFNILDSQAISSRTYREHCLASLFLASLQNIGDGCRWIHPRRGFVCEECARG